MTFDPTKPPFRTKNGMEVSLITADGRLPQPIIGYVGHDDGVSSWSNDGTYHRDGKPSCLDLVNIPEEQFIWVNVYKVKESMLFSVFLFTSREDADEGADERRVSRLKIKLVEGRWDD